MPTQLPRVPSLIPSSFATLAIGRDVSITIFTASSLNSGEKLFFGRGNYFTFPDGPSYWTACPEGSGHLRCRCSLTTRAGPEPGGDLLVSPADRRSVGRPFNHCRDLLGRSYFRDCHEADTHHCIEVVAVRPLS